MNWEFLNPELAILSLYLPAVGTNSLPQDVGKEGGQTGGLEKEDGGTLVLLSLALKGTDITSGVGDGKYLNLVVFY